jgi:WD40 repeat protein
MVYSELGVVRVWDVPARKVLGEVRGGSPALSPDGKKLATATKQAASIKGSVTVWDTKTWQELATLPCEAVAQAIAFSPDNKTVAVGSYEGRVRLWDVAKDEVIDEPGPNPTENVVALLFSPDGKVLAYATRDGTIKLYDITARKVLATIKSKKAAKLALAFSKEGKVLAYVEPRSKEQLRPRLRLWDIAAGKEAGEIILPNSNIAYLHQLDDGKSWLIWVDNWTTL